MAEINHLEFIEKLYFHELERKQSLESMFALPSGVIAGLFGGVSYFSSSFSSKIVDHSLGLPLVYLFYGTAMVTFIFLIFATFWCAKAAIGAGYEYLPDGKMISDYWNELENWYVQQKKSRYQKALQADFQEFLIGALGKCCKQTALTNYDRFEDLYRAKRSIIFALISVAFLSLFYYISVLTAYLHTQ